MDPAREAAAEPGDEPEDLADGDSTSREAEDIRDVELGGVDTNGGDFTGDEGAEEDTASVEGLGGDESFIRCSTASSGGEGVEERAGGLLAGC